jgi:hypothetical protein
VRTALASPLLEVSVGSDPWTISLGGPDLHQAEPLAFLIEGRWPGPLPPPDEDPGAGGAWCEAGRVLDEHVGDRVYRAMLATDAPPLRPGARAAANVRSSSSTTAR